MGQIVSINKNKANIDFEKVTSAAHFQRVLKELLHSKILSDHERVVKDLDYGILKFTKNNSFNLSVKKARKLKKTFSDDVIKKYISFISCMIAAGQGISPYKEFVGDSLNAIVNLCSGESARTCWFLFLKAVENVDVETETVEKALMSSVVKMNEVLELPELKNVEKAKQEMTEELNEWIKTINSVLAHLERHNKVLTGVNVKNRVVKFHLNLYKMFKYRTEVEFTKDVSVLKGVLRTIDLLMSVVPSSRVFIIKNLISSWPTSYRYQAEAIETFMGACATLNGQEQNDLRSEVAEKLNELLLRSKSEIFLVACREFSVLPKDFFWLSNCSGDQKRLFLMKRISLRNKLVKRKECQEKRREKIKTEPVKPANGLVSKCGAVTNVFVNSSVFFRHIY